MLKRVSSGGLTGRLRKVSMSEPPAKKADALPDSSIIPKPLPIIQTEQDCNRMTVIKITKDTSRPPGMSSAQSDSAPILDANDDDDIEDDGPNFFANLRVPSGLSSSPSSSVAVPSLPVSDDDDVLEEDDVGANFYTSTQQPEKMMTCTFIKSNRLGASCWLKDEYHYCYKLLHKNKTKDLVYYACTERLETGCKATAIYNTANEGFVDRFLREHNHEPNEDKLSANLTERSVIDHLASSCSTQMMGTNRVLATVIRKLEEKQKFGALAYVSKKESLRSRARRAKIKSKMVIVDKVPTTWSELKAKGIPEIFKTLSDGSQFLRFMGPVKDTGDEMMLIFASENGLQLLQQAKIISCDGTFSTCPPPFCQLFVIMSQLNPSVNIPCVFGLLPNKFTGTYVKFFKELASMTENMFQGEGLPSMVACDFEIAIRTSIRAVIPRAKISCCLVHFERAIDRNIAAKQLGELRKKSSPFSTGVRYLKSMAFVPPDHVQAAYNIVVQHFDAFLPTFCEIEPAAKEKIDKFLSYIEAGFIGKPATAGVFRPPLFPILSWNKHEETMTNVQRTNNTCEGFNSSWRRDVGPFPSLWKVCGELINRDRLATMSAHVALTQVSYRYQRLNNLA